MCVCALRLSFSMCVKDCLTCAFSFKKCLCVCIGSGFLSLLFFYFYHIWTSHPHHFFSGSPRTALCVEERFISCLERGVNVFKQGVLMEFSHILLFIFCYLMLLAASIPHEPVGQLLVFYRNVINLYVFIYTFVSLSFFLYPSFCFCRNLSFRFPRR